MKFTEIKYKAAGKVYSAIVEERKGWENQYLQNIINRIESITNSETGTGDHFVIVGIKQYKGRKNNE